MAEYYRQLLKVETDYLTARIAKYNAILDSDAHNDGDCLDSTNNINDNINNNNHNKLDIADGDEKSSTTTITKNKARLELTENVIGQIRLVIGQSNLFIKERFKQFAGLIDDCELKRGEKETKVEDLAGFWDMIFYQVEDLKTKYVELDALERNNWQQKSASNSTTVNGGAGDQHSKIQPKNSHIHNQHPHQQQQPVISKKVTNGTAATTIPTKSTTTAQNRTSNVPIGKSSVRSNFREFLKNKRKEAVVTKPSETDDQITIIASTETTPKQNGTSNSTPNSSSVAPASTTTSTSCATNGALANGTHLHLNGCNGLQKQAIAASNGYHAPHHRHFHHHHRNHYNYHLNDHHGHNNSIAENGSSSNAGIDSQKLKSLTEIMSRHTLTSTVAVATPVHDETNKEN